MVLKIVPETQISVKLHDLAWVSSTSIVHIWWKIGTNAVTICYQVIFIDSVDFATKNVAKQPHAVVNF